MNENKEHDNCKLMKYKKLNFLFIRLSAMLWEYFDSEESPINRVSDKRVNACFSTHCSRNELIYFVNYFSPKKICGFPNEYHENKTMNVDLETNDNLENTMTKKRKFTENEEKCVLTANDKIHRNRLKEMFAKY